MNTGFERYKIRDIRKLIDEQELEADIYSGLNDRTKHLLKPINKKYKDIYIFTKLGFQRYSESRPAKVIGKINVKQHRYEDYADEDLLTEQKLRKRIVGCCELNTKDGERKKFDMKEPGQSHIIGYAWVGGNWFIEVTSFRLIYLLIPLLITVIIACIFSNCPKPDNTVLPWADQSDTDGDENNNTGGEVPLCYFTPFPETVTLTSEKKTIKLRNVAENKGNYYISYEIFVDGERIKIRDNASDESAYITGLIEPGNHTSVDLWSKLDEGTYKLVCKASEYGYKNKDKKEIQYDLTAVLAVEK